MTIPTLETDQLVLRPFVLDDLDALAAILGDAETMAYYRHPFSREESLAWIERTLEHYERHGFGLFALELRVGGLFVGDCGPTIQMVEIVAEVELGWHVRRDLWNRGLASEAACAARDWAFDGLGLERLISLVRPENKASCRVAEKIGMTVEREVDYKGYRHRVYAMTCAGR